MKRRWSYALGTGIALATLSCQIILGLEEPTGTPAQGVPPTDTDAGQDPNDPCPHARPPAVPKDDDPDTKQTYWFASKHIGTLDQTGTQGYDLDNACTCQKDLRDGGPSCTTSSATVCDRNGGIDDSFGSLLGGLPSTISENFTQPVNRNLEDGTRTLLIYMEGYNGKANDADVRVQFVNGGGLYDARGCDGVERPLVVSYQKELAGDRAPPGKNRYRPASDGCDRWSPEVGALGVGRVPSNLVKGYVADSELVVTIDTVANNVFGNRSTISGAVFTAKIVQENGHIRLDGVLSGRIPYQELLQAVGGGQVGDGEPDGSDYTAVCQTDFWPFVISKICDARDIMVTDTQDRQGRECDATSIGVGFTMVQAAITDFDFTGPQSIKACPAATCPK